MQELNLSDAQKKEIKALKMKQRQAWESMKPNKENFEKSKEEFKANREEHFSKMKAMREQHDAEFKQILSKEQASKYDAMKAERMEVRKQMKDGGYKGHPHKGHRGHAHKGKRGWYDQLDLSDAQKSELKEIREKYRGEKKSTNWENAKEDQEKAREYFQSMRAKQRNEMKNVLTREQLEKIENMHTRKSGERRGMRKHHDGHSHDGHSHDGHNHHHDSNDEGKINKNKNNDKY